MVCVQSMAGTPVITHHSSPDHRLAQFSLNNRHKGGINDIISVSGSYTKAVDFYDFLYVHRAKGTIHFQEYPLIIIVHDFSIREMYLVCIRAEQIDLNIIILVLCK